MLLMGWASVVDPNKVMTSGEVQITGIEWYLGTPSAGNRISANADYILSDTGCPIYSLKVKKNIDVNTPCEIYAVMSFTDKRTNKKVTIERSIPLRTTYYDSTNYSVKLNQPTGFTVDPTRTTEDVNGDWPIDLKAQLYSGKDAVPDANAAYWWYVLENGAYRLIDPAKDLFLMTKPVNGRLPRSIIVNGLFINTASFKVRATYYTDDTPPANPAEDSVQATTTMKVMLPVTAIAKMTTNQGLYIAPDADQPIECEVIIEDNGGLINNPDKYYFVIWMAEIGVSGARQIGHGMKLNTTSKTLGITNTNGCSVYPIVYQKAAYEVLTDHLGEPITDHLGQVIVVKTLKK